MTNAIFQAMECFVWKWAQFFDLFGANAKGEEYSLQKEYGKYQPCTFLLVRGRVSIHFKNITEIKLFTKEIQDNYFFI